MVCKYCGAAITTPRDELCGPCGAALDIYLEAHAGDVAEREARLLDEQRYEPEPR